MNKFKLRGAALLLLLCLVLVLILAAGCRASGPDGAGSMISGETEQLSAAESREETQSAIESEPEESSEPESEPEPVFEPVRLLAVGDNLIHDTLYNQAGRRTGGEGYDFLPVYDNVAELIGKADIAVINQETPLSASNPPSTYPMFNCPTEMAGQLAQLGFDVVNIANNHMLDKFAAGLEETIGLLRSTDGIAAVTGGYLGAEEWDEIPVVEKNGIKFAFLGYTESTNGISLPAGREGMIIYTSNEAEIEKQVRAARELADVVVVSCHWGVEYTHTPTDGQRALAKKLAQWGADIVIGHHPHVIQPYEWLDGTLVIYSLGNFVSAQGKPETLIGALVQLDIEKDSGGITISEPEITPVITHYDAGNYNVRIYRFDQYSDELAAVHGVVVSHGKQFSMGYIRSVLTEVYGGEW